MIFSIDESGRSSRIALIEGDTGASWTYGELGAEVTRRRELLERREKSLLFLFCRNDCNSVAWYLAALEAGHVVALLNDRLNLPMQEELIARYRPEWILSPPAAQREQFADPDGEGICRRRTTEDAPPHQDVAVLLSTSGSTGSPKFVRLTRGNIEANAASIREALGIGAADVPVAHLPLHYSYGLSVLNSHLLAGASILLTGASLMSPAFWESIRQHRVDSFSGVPYTYQMLRRLGLENVNAPTLRILTQAGGKLDPETIRHFQEALAPRRGTFWVMYGQTEATARISILPASALPEKLGSAGRAIPGGRVSVLTGTGEQTAAGIEGEIVYRGPNVMLGYAMERRDLERGDELRGCLYTGDRGRLDADGYVTILGRSKRDAKLFGLRVNLDELEGLVKLHGPVAAVAIPNRVVFFCEFGGPALHGSIREGLCERLKIHHSAFEFRRIPVLPVKDTGKINYDALLASL